MKYSIRKQLNPYNPQVIRNYTYVWLKEMKPVLHLGSVRSHCKLIIYMKKLFYFSRLPFSQNNFQSISNSHNLSKSSLKMKPSSASKIILHIVMLLCLNTLNLYF